ncbi:hypothetical protein [Actinobaculum sp. 352]|uniref:hypothetical protein n=1 Tax=Actinobaculum sp. 352 TaxID=2490946 RepID=UPI000F7F7547|nr:hypothetical protein [Actinobaculum sp. 352]RTE47919.1 hypothetical protein EKN07_11715 [Actinobaculum sp. 352]
MSYLEIRAEITQRLIDLGNDAERAERAADYIYSYPGSSALPIAGECEVPIDDVHRIYRWLQEMGAELLSPLALARATYIRDAPVTAWRNLPDYAKREMLHQSRRALAAPSDDHHATVDMVLRAAAVYGPEDVIV